MAPAFPDTILFFASKPVARGKGIEKSYHSIAHWGGPVSINEHDERSGTAKSTERSPMA